MSQKQNVEKALARLIQENELKPGTLIKAEVFENLLGLSRNEQAYSFLISRIRHALYEHGIYLSGEGFSETGAYEIADPRDHYWIAKLAVAKAARDLEGKQTLLLNTPLEGLNDLEKRRHENGLRDLSQKLDAMRRAHEVSQMIVKGQRKKKALEEE